MIEVLTTIVLSVWYYYFVPGIVVTAATLVTETLMISKAEPRLPGRPNRILSLAVALIISLWRWPTPAIMALVSYIKGETMVIILDRMDTVGHQNKAGIENRSLPIGRTWEKRKNAEGCDFFYYITDFHRATGQPPERRLTHIARHPKNDQVFVLRCMTGDKTPLPFGVFNGVQQAKLACETDTEWLDLCTPAKDVQRETLYQEMIDRYHHPA